MAIVTRDDKAALIHLREVMNWAESAISRIEQGQRDRAPADIDQIVSHAAQARQLISK